MSYSYYEVFTNTQRAFSGLGFPYGSDEEAAFIITWLELCGLNGIELLTSKINELGWKSKVSLREGLEKTYEWFLENNN